jgi:hypothetical protein
MDTLCAVHGVPSMFGKENSNKKLENIVFKTIVQHPTNIAVN